MSKKALIFIVMLIVSAFCLYFIDADSPTQQKYQTEYNVIIGSMFVFGLIYSFAISRSVSNLFQPLHILAFFYLCIFFITPLFLINAHKEDCCGVNVMGGCIEGTFLVLLAFISFCIGCLRFKKKDSVMSPVKDIPEERKNKILKISYLLFGIFSVANIGLLIAIGYNIGFLFTLGGQSGGLAEVAGIPDNLRFLFNLGYVMLVPWLFMCAYSKKKWIILLSSYILLVIFFAYGWRFIIYIVVISGAIIYYRTRNKQPKLTHIIFLGLALFVYSAIGGMARGSMRKGQTVSMEEFDDNTLVYTLESNFNIYQTYYGVVNTYPGQHGYYYGQAVIASPIIMWIPRIIWPSKPRGEEYPMAVAIMKSCGDSAITGAAMASPNIMEYYLDFGIFGVILFSFILGVVCRKMMKLYYSNSLYGIIKYALFCGFLIQLINRGYMAQLCTLIVILYLPLLLYRKYYRG